MAQQPNRRRRSAKNMHRRRRRLLERCVPRFALGGYVTYEHVSDLYEDRDDFLKDCHAIKKTLDDLRDWLEVLGVPIPAVEAGGGKFAIPVRGFTARIDSEQKAERARLAKALIDYKLGNGHFLVPRLGTVYFGFGTTVLAAAEQMFTRRDEFRSITVSTANVEILVKYYFLASAILGAGDFILANGGTIDWNDGCFIPETTDSEVATSIVSFEAIDEQWRFYADMERKRDLVQDALATTRDRIILVGDHDKFKPPYHGYPISLPENDGHRKIFLFTNRPVPRKHNRSRKNLPVRVKVLVATDTPSAPENESPPRKAR